MRAIIRSWSLIIFLLAFGLCVSTELGAQTQDDFMQKVSDIFVNAGDSKKALELAKALFNTIEQKKDLQTYANYYILKNIFENQAKDAALAKTCAEKAEKAMNAMVGAAQPATTPGSDLTSQWTQVYFPALFSTADSENALKASQFLAKNPSFQTFNNFNYIAYAYERNGDFQKAKENYEKASAKKGDDKSEFHSYSYYTNFMSRSGEYLKAEEFIARMDRLSGQAVEMLRTAYKSESMTSKVVYYLSIGDYQSYVDAANESYDYFSKTLKDKLPCDPYSSGRYAVTAHGREMLGQFGEAQKLWRRSDSSQYALIACNKEKYPNYKQYPLSYLPVFLIKTGNRKMLPRPVSFYIKETEDHFNSYSQYADLSINFAKAAQLGFLGSPGYSAAFDKVLTQITGTRNFRESTSPIAYYAYFAMRDRKYDQASELYNRLFKLNVGWINDVIFSFGEKAFVTYYNSKLKDGYDGYHSFVKIAKENQSKLLPSLSSQAYNNLLFTKSLSLKGTQKRKKAFLKANDAATVKLYEEWISKKEQLIRFYRKVEDAQAASSGPPTDPAGITKLQGEVDHLENELVAKAKDFEKYLKIVPPDWKTVRSNLKEGEAAIELVRFQWRNQVYYSDTAYYAAYVITKSSDHPDVIYLPTPPTDLDNRFYRAYQNSIKFKTEDKESYNRYWKPIRESLKGVKKVYFSPDGIYHLISLPTLQNPESGKYLLEELDIQYTTGTADIGSSSADGFGTAVLLGRPSYKVQVQSQSPIGAETSTRSFVRSFRDNAISDLPGTEEEVKTIKSEMDANSVKTTVFLRDQATEGKMYELHSPDVLHIATHGYWSESGKSSTAGYRVFNAMANSGLLLSGVVNYYSAVEYPDTYDGILTAYEAQNMDLENTSLVVLSACETSLGHLDAGEGVYGLQRAFRAAGAKSIMTSLWKVDDEATKEFMIIFYRELLKSKNKFQSFSGAQKELKQKFPEPYYWGAFVLTGSE